MTYSDLVIGGEASNNTALSALTVDGVALTYDETSRTYTGTAADLSSAVLSVAAADPGAKLTVNGTAVNSYQTVQSIPLSDGENTVAITVTAADGTTTADYTITITNTITSTPGGGSGSTRYTITAPGEVDRGTVSVSPSRASRGQTVTITVTPEDGYELGSLTVTDAGGDTIALTDAGNGRYTFNMPASRVIVSASFVEAGHAGSCPSAAFSDLNLSGWYHEATDYVIANGLMNGVSADKFDPSGTLTRAMMVTLLWRLEEELVVNYLLPFEDVPEDTWYTEAVRWAASEGIVLGTSETTYDPASPITREQLAAMLYRYAAYKGYDVSGHGDLSAFTDADRVSAYAAGALAWAVAEELVNGMGDGTLQPRGNATRAQTAALLMRFVEAFAS